jgi:hypothetical protein
MADHARFTVDTGIAVYFCDPKSPWQRGSNENTNRLLRQYLPRHVNLRDYSQDDLDDIAAELNGRPRLTVRMCGSSRRGGLTGRLTDFVSWKGSVGCAGAGSCAPAGRAS